ncbi:MAG: TIM44-like domain-containing protein [Novosphingobium sp.]
MTGKKFRTFSAIAMGMAAFVMMATPADARRGGSFGSRGSRTAVAPPTTSTAPKQAAPVQRTMTDRQTAPNAAQNPAAARTPTGQPAKSGGLAKGLIGGLLAGGLIAMLMGGGLGALGGAGMLSALLQVALIGGLVWLALRLFRRRNALAPAGVPGMAQAAPRDANPFAGAQPIGLNRTAQGAAFGGASGDLAITMADKQAFERLLGEVQQAFSREDYAALRACTTPEVMSYLAEELSQNATNGLRNEVSGTELLEAEVAEAWSEGDADYATIAMQYHSIDLMRDRNTGAVVQGDPTQPTHTTELWTFVRDSRNPWRLSAIQEA